MKNKGPSPTPRSLAAKIIEKTLAGAKAQEAFSRLAEASGLSRKDRQLCSDLVYGFLRNKIRLDFIMGLFLKKAEKLPAQMRVLLGLGLYSLFFQDKTPSYAAVNETVEEIKKMHGQSLAKVANGVLRNAQKLERKPYDPEWFARGLGDEIKGCSVFYSMPEPLVRLWMNSYGREDALKLLARSSRRPWQGIRVNPLHEKAAELDSLLKNSPERESAGAFGHAFPPGKTPEKLAGKVLDEWIEDGALSLQAPGSMIVMEELGLAGLEGPIWDCCAGSGIKSAALMERGADIALASDMSRQRLKNISPFCARLGLRSPGIFQASAAKPPLKSWGGHIIADVPCSGTGVLARRPDIRENLREENFWHDHARTQKDIMTSLAGLLRPGKKLAYITCALNPNENQNLVREILGGNPELALEKEWQTPHDHPWLEGMYGAVLEKKAC